MEKRKTNMKFRPRSNKKCNINIYIFDLQPFTLTVTLINVLNEIIKGNSIILMDMEILHESLYNVTKYQKLKFTIILLPIKLLTFQI